MCSWLVAVVLFAANTLLGTLNRHRKLKLIMDHMGEFLPMTLARDEHDPGSGSVPAFVRSVAQTFQEQIYVTAIGQFTCPPMMALLGMFGIHHGLFSVDYIPSSSTSGAEVS